MFLSRILILPAVVASLALAGATANTAWANDDVNPELQHIADDLMEVIERAHHHPDLLDHAFFESLDLFGHDDYVRLAFYRALPAIDWYRNHDAQHWVRENQSHYYHDFLDANRVTVAVVVESNSEYLTSRVTEGVIARLPEHATYANDPGYADIVISVRLGDMEPQFREKSRKPKSKKYKKAYRSKPPPEEQIHFANYTKVKEKVSVSLAYEFEITERGGRLSGVRSSMRLSNNFSYGVDFQAYGPNGPVSGAPYPSKKVSKLMERDAEARRTQIADRLVGMAATQVAAKLDYNALPLRSELGGHHGRSSHR